jgi:hypothetical protein
MEIMQAGSLGGGKLTGDACYHNIVEPVLTCRGPMRMFRAARHPDDGYGAVAQLGERVVRNDEVSGSIPLSSTIVSR